VRKQLRRRRLAFDAVQGAKGKLAEAQVYDAKEVQ
jgi:hypothetical protein